jgi:probable rRNA maturation factor
LSHALPRVELALAVDEQSLPLAAKRLVAQAATVLDRAGLPGRLSLAVVDDGTMRTVNRDFHDCDEPTDVLAFPLGGDGDAFGYEVVVSLETAVREAARRGVRPEAELILYVTHGLLHLAGEDDHDPEAARRMHLRTLGILEELGHVNTIELPPRPQSPEGDM